MTGPLFLEGERVTLHPVEEADLEFLQDVINHPRVREDNTTTRPLNMADEREWFEADDGDGVRLLVRAANAETGSQTDAGGGADGRVGSISYRDVNSDFGTAEVAYAFHPDAWGNGYATDALGRLVEYGFRERRLAKFWARVIETNAASQRVLEKVGFQREGAFRDHAYKAGKRVDLYQYGLLATEWDEHGDKDENRDRDRDHS